MILAGPKRILKSNKLTYEVSKTIYNFIWTCSSPARLRKWRNVRRATIDFRNGVRLVKTRRLGYDVQYEAISPRNLRQLRHKGEEDKFMATVFEEIGEGDTVLDIGGHVGMWTILFAKQVGPKGAVYALEPERQGHEAIKRNVELNGLRNVEAIRAAVADKDTTAKLYVRPCKATHSIFEQTNAPSPTGRQDEFVVEVVTIDRLVEQGRIKAPDFVKIDVEGAELLALEGMKNSLQSVRAVLVEHHETLRLQGYDDPRRAVKEKLISLGIREIKELDSAHLLGLNR